MLDAITIGSFVAGLLGCNTDMQCEHVAGLVDIVALDIVSLWAMAGVVLCLCYWRKIVADARELVGRVFGH